MLFSSLIFLIGFLPLTIGVYFLIPKRCKLRNFFLTIMSLFFYAWGEPRFVLAMIVSIIVNYLFALIIDHQRNNEKKQEDNYRCNGVVQSFVFVCFQVS